MKVLDKIKDMHRIKKKLREWKCLLLPKLYGLNSSIEAINYIDVNSTYI